MQNFTKSSSSKKQTHQNNQTLTRLRQLRIRKSTSLLGQPDIITVTKCKTKTSFFSKQKRNEQCSQYFINGIIFPTTAHFSTYISSKYQNSDLKSSSHLSIKARLIMFDAFHQKDVHVQINIPGSLQVKVFNLAGQALKSQSEDYERAYFSSYLRSLQPMNYPNIVLNPYIYKVQIHKQVLRKIVPFCFQNSLRQLRYQICCIFTSQLQIQYSGNWALEIIFNFVTKNKFWNLLDVVITQIQKVQNQIQLGNLQYLNHRLLYLKKEYEKTLSYSSEILIRNPTLNQWKELQIQCLFKLKNYKAAKLLGQNLIRRGGTHSKIYELIGMSYLQTNDYRNFLKVFNSILTLYNQEEVYMEEVSHKTKRLYFMDITFNRGQAVSSYPQLCFQFDNVFLNKQSKIGQYKESMSHSLQATQKQQPLKEMLRLIERIDQSLDYCNIPKKQADNAQNNNLRTFYSLLVKFEKLKGWTQVIKLRGQCFWLQIDFKNQEEEMLEKSILISFNTSGNMNSPKKQSEKLAATFESKYNKNNAQNFNDIEIGQLGKIEAHEIEFDNQQGAFYQAELSEQLDQQEIEYMPVCSKRVYNNAYTTRKNSVQINKTDNPQNIKVLCSMNLERLFISLYEDLKLQIQIQKWASNINLGKLSEISAQKRQLIAIVFLKKAFLHLKLERYRKCEESLKTARKISQSALILLISAYQLIRIYMQNNSMKGVQFYIVDLIKILNLYGVKKFDIVPEWAKQIITFIIENQGIGILGKLAGPFKQLSVRWLRNDHSQSSLFKRDSTNKPQNMCKLST